MPLLTKATPVLRAVRDLVGRIKDLDDHGVDSAAERRELHGLLRDKSLWLWLRRAWGFKILGDLLRHRAQVAKSVSGVEDLENFLAELTQELAPARFEFKGFPVVNLDRVAEHRVLALLDGVSFIVELFKKRKMERLLVAGVSKVVIDAEDDSAAHGSYVPTSQEIHLMPRALDSRGHLWKSWAQEVFLHEFGHHVHLNYIPSQAREHWNSAWGPIKDLEQRHEGKNYNVSYTMEDRRGYYRALSRADWNPSKASRKFKELDRVKFGEWLRNYGVRGQVPLIADKSFRLTQHGQQVLGQLSGKVPVEDYEALIKRVRANLFLDDGVILHIPFKVITELATKDRDIGSKAIEEAKAELGIPTNYGRTNETEDFAETWVAFMVNPRVLSPRATLRMQQTLALSGLYGKEVLRLAQRVAVRYELETQSARDSFVCRVRLLS